MRAEGGGTGSLREGVGLVRKLEHDCSGVSWRWVNQSIVVSQK